jgi:hypothetical protein
VGFCVRPQPPAAGVGGGLHAIDVPLETRLLDEDAGRPQLGYAHRGSLSRMTAPMSPSA